MPTYDYQCSACDYQFELFQSISAPVKRKCPECGKQKLKRLIGPGAAVVFKGSGFYQTDYRSESYKKRAAEDNKSQSSSSKDSSSKDSKSTSKESGTKASKKSSDKVTTKSSD